MDLKLLGDKIYKPKTIWLPQFFVIYWPGSFGIFYIFQLEYIYLVILNNSYILFFEENNLKKTSSKN